MRAAAPRTPSGMARQQVGRAVTLVAVGLIAAGLGFGATIATAVVVPDPPVFLTAGLLTTTAATAAGTWPVLRAPSAGAAAVEAAGSRPRGRDARTAGTAAVTIGVTAAVALAVLVPLHDPPTPSPEGAFWPR